VPRLILVSNRLPIAARRERGELVVSQSAGGLATGLMGLHERGEGLWIGWPGETWRLDAAERASLRRQLTALRCEPVELSAREVEHYYESFSNSILWPLLHYELERLPTHPRGWDAYQRVNERFADVVVERYRPGDVIWIHDYQLMLVPGLVRRRLPDAPIGLFFHVPFPSSELFRILPWRRELLEGMLGATLVGFHTASYAGHFISSAAKILGCETRAGRVRIDGRQVRVADFPMGIDAATYDRLARQPAIESELAKVRRGRQGIHLVVAVDRLDYTKGIPRRLLAFERLLERYPDTRSTVQLVQVASPSREAVSQYRDYRRSVDELVGRLNGRFATLGHQPINYISRTLSRERLIGLYRAASVAMITPQRDGMNLVAKEFVASRVDEDGVLVLSEFAGAAAELSGALLVNPYDLDGVASTLHHALEMAPAERRERMRSLRGRVMAHDVHRWAREFVAALRAEHRRGTRRSPADSLATFARPMDLVAELAHDAHRPLTLVVDYDGTLVPLRSRPEEAVPDDEILRILATLAGLPGLTVHVASGRRREDLERWLGHLGLGLHAEHGLWSRAPGEAPWRPRLDERPGWLDSVRPSVDRAAEQTPGSFVEEKEASIAWHYRNADEETGRRAARGLLRSLPRTLAGEDASVLDGDRVVEVRSGSIHKGRIVEELLGTGQRSRLVILGDDLTDEDMFRSAPADAMTIRVGGGPTIARHRLAGPDQVRAFLADLARARTGLDILSRVPLPRTGPTANGGHERDRGDASDAEGMVAVADREG
jgi:trehalose 6-phosphate synthase/phosphatase